MTLEGITDEEREMTKGMPDQVAIGVIKAHRAKKQDTPDILAGLAEMFDVFKQPGQQ